MNRKNIIAIVACLFSVIIGGIYLAITIILDSRGPILPPPPEAFGAVGVVYSHFF